MIKYNRKKKKLVIPDGLGNKSFSNYEEAYNTGYQKGYNNGYADAKAEDEVEG